MQIKFTMQTTFVRMLVLSVGMMTVARPVFSANNAFFKPFDGSSSGDFDEAENWYLWENYNASQKVGKVPDGCEVYLRLAGQTVICTNDHTVNNLEVKSSDATRPNTFVLDGNCTLKPWLTKIFNAGYLDIRAGSTLRSRVSGDGAFCLDVGGEEWAVVTNAGTLAVGAKLVHWRLGKDAGTKGRYVFCPGAEQSFTDTNHQHDLYVGVEGEGELDILAGAEFKWAVDPWSRNLSKVQVGGTPEVESRVIVRDQAKFSVAYLYLGGYPDHVKGHGCIELRGGQIVQPADNGYGGGQYRPNYFIGACPSTDGAPDPDCYGRIRGWGSFGHGQNASGSRGITANFGYGEIIADGEGEDRYLNCTDIYLVTNVVFGTGLTASGWRAVNKGRLGLPPAQIDSCAAGTVESVCVGCSPRLEKPDLVNAVRVKMRRKAVTYNPYIGVQVLATDSELAHAAPLTAKGNVLGVWQVGMFNTGWEREKTAARKEYEAFDVAFRCDQTKLLGTDTHLCLYRYSEADGRWQKLTSCARPDDMIVSSGDLNLAPLDEAYTMGTFAVVEQEERGMVILFR